MGRQPELDIVHPEKEVSEEGSSVMKLDKGADEAGAFVGAAHGVAIDDETNRAILRKIDFRLMPIMSGLYLLQYLDKVTLSYAAVMDLMEDTGMSNAEYSWAGSIFYLGYLAFEYPHNRLMQTFPIAKYMSVMVIFWGAVLCFSALVHDFAGVMVTRFFLGAGEGSITAGFVLITARWYTTAEQPFRTGIWFTFNGMAQIVGGAIAYGVSTGLEKNPIGIAPWKFLFIIVGVITFLYGIAMWFLLADSPITAPWLSDSEKHVAVERIRGNQQGIGSKIFKWYQVREAFTDIRTYIYFFCIICINIPNGGLTVFFTLMIKSYGFTSQQSFLLSMPAGGLQLVIGWGIPYLASRTGQRALMAIVCMLLGLFGIALMTGLAKDDPLNARVGQLFAYYLMIPSPSTALILIITSVGTNAAGYTKKTTVNAITLIGYCIGFLIGPQTFRDAPYYYNAKYVIIAMWFIALCFFVVLYFLNKWENAKRDRIWEEAGCPQQPPGQEFMDMTDKENSYFRYAM
ncbi:putative mfs allantoate protein [Eutypa lata UCREL1]|uniref:Putative mfs allantoate protein n=1 Tax=Eutypa lata (strain UCR-EL1) TaxID=1287681 RepID=M7TFU9_EUTLA|nr:putative mfs allantoate protein [Eutypa lata UCREL1]